MYDPGKTGCVEATFIKKMKTLHLEKNCPTDTNASAGAEVTGVSGRRPVGLVHAGERDPVPGWLAAVQRRHHNRFLLPRLQQRDADDDADGTVTYTFTAATLAAAGQQVPTPTGTIESVSVLIDVQGTADLTKVMVNGKLQKFAPGHADLARSCKKGGWKSFSSPAFKNQGQCVKYVVHGRNAAN